MKTPLRSIIGMLGMIIITATAAFAADAPDGSANLLNTQGLSVSPCEPNNIRVCSINLTSSKAGSNSYTVTGKVTVVQSSYPYNEIANASVNITWTRPNAGSVTQTGTTSSSGLVSFTTTGSGGNYTCVVNSVTKSGYSYDASNSVTSKTIKP